MPSIQPSPLYSMVLLPPSVVGNVIFAAVLVFTLSDFIVPQVLAASAVVAQTLILSQVWMCANSSEGIVLFHSPDLTSANIISSVPLMGWVALFPSDANVHPSTGESPAQWTVGSMPYWVSLGIGYVNEYVPFSIVAGKRLELENDISVCDGI